ncbi:hypothetical protein BV378_14460 [Nostoc sp. RF31YmG]|nr:hypothetical protein BV378_14460 [Nostoc sp. RF31YmG]
MTAGTVAAWRAGLISGRYRTTRDTDEDATDAQGLDVGCDVDRHVARRLRQRWLGRFGRLPPARMPGRRRSTHRLARQRHVRARSQLRHRPQLEMVDRAAGQGFHEGGFRQEE